MSRTFVSIVAVVALIGVFLVYKATRESSALVLLPSQLVAHNASASLSRVRVGARVAPLPIEYALEPRLELKFSVNDPGTAGPALPVVYKGLKPDMFAPGRDVIIDGEYRAGVLHAAKLLTQCPSKYEPPVPSEKK